LQKQLEDCVDAQSVSARLQDAMRYSLLSGGKRFRPLLVLASAQAVGAVTPMSMSAAVSVECIHAYSLIHDDLPAMDDDALRRGKPTNHIQFDEATAILAGDALQTLAFEVLARQPEDIRVQRLVLELSRAAGATGMVAGQMADLLAEGQAASLDLNELQAIHRGKTGALISASARMGAISGSASDAQVSALGRYADALGLAFQIHDDVLDVVADSATLGKTQGADGAKHKSTYVSVLGLEEARSRAVAMVQRAHAELESFGARADYLKALADYAILRAS
jgi:geranylgeranyl pyrophosphate synthase